MLPDSAPTKTLPYSMANLDSGHLALFGSEKRHVRNAHARRAVIVQRAGKARRIAFGELLQRGHEHGVEVIALEACGSDRDRLAGVVRNAALMTDIALGVLHRRNDGVKIVRLYFGAFVDHHNLCAVAAHGADRKALDLGAVSERADALVARKLHRPVAVRLDLAHDLRVADEVVLYLLDDQRRLLRRAGYHGNQAARVEDANGDTAQRRQPRLAVAAAFDHHERVRVAKLPGDHLLRVLEPDPEILPDENILMRPPVMDLPGPELLIANIPNLRDRHTTTCSSPTAAMVCLKSA